MLLEVFEANKNHNAGRVPEYLRTLFLDKESKWHNFTHQVNDSVGRELIKKMGFRAMVSEFDPGLHDLVWRPKKFRNDPEARERLLEKVNTATMEETS